MKPRRFHKNRHSRIAKARAIILFLALASIKKSYVLDFNIIDKNDSFSTGTCVKAIESDRMHKAFGKDCLSRRDARFYIYRI